MSTSSLPMARDHGNRAQETFTTLYGSGEAKLEFTKTRGRRKSSRGQNPKKQPQRGLGVAQLERLRLEERWKKMTEISNGQPFTISNQFQNQSMLMDLATGLKGNGSRFDHGGLVGLTVPNGVICGEGTSGFPCQSTIGIYETSMELSSMPKTQRVSDCHGFCFKRKPFNLNPVTGVVPPIFHRDSPALNLENTANLNGEPSGFSLLGKGASVKQIHRIGNPLNGGVFMEYEFFPGRRGRGAAFKELGLPSEADSVVVAEGGEDSCITKAGYGSGSAGAVDLSLKLSF